MIVSNRKLFKKRPARDNLNQVAGIMASSPELMNEVQRFDNGGSVNPISNFIMNLPELVVSGRRGPNELARQRSVRSGGVVISEVPVKLPSGEMGYAIYDNGDLKGYQSETPGGSMIDRSKEIEEIKKEVNPPVNVSSTSLSNFLRGIIGSDKGRSEAVQEFEEAKERGELGIQDSYILDKLGGKGSYAESLLTGILRLAPELQEFIGDLSGSALDVLGQQTDETKRRSVSETIPGVVYKDQKFPENITPDVPFKMLDREGFRNKEAEILEKLKPIVSKEDPKKDEIQAMLERVAAMDASKDIAKGTGPKADESILSYQQEMAKRKAIEDLSRATGPKADEEVLKQYQQDKEFAELNRSMAEATGPKVPPEGRLSPQEVAEDISKGIDPKVPPEGRPKTSAEENFGTVNQVVQKTTGTDIKSLMEEFTSQAPEYEGMNKGMAIAKIGFAMAAGQSPNGLTNIANALSMGADMFLKDDKEKQAFNRQLKLSALQYGLGEISKERAQARSDARSFQQFVDKDGKPVLVPLSKIMESDGLLPEGVQYKDLYLENVKAADERLRAILEEKKKRIDDLVLNPDEQRKALEVYEEASIDFQQSTNAAALTEKLTLQVADESNNITSLGTAFKDLVNKAFNAAGINLGKKYETLADFQADLKIAFQELIPLKLGATQSANSISDRDVNLLARAYFGTAVLEGGSFSLAGIDPDVLTKKLQNVLGEFQSYANSALLKMKSEEEFLFRSGYLQADRETLVADRIKAFKPEGIDDITAYDPNMTYDKNKNRYIINIGGK